MATKELMVRVGADASNFEKTMGNVQKRMKNVGDRMKNTGNSMSKWISGPIAGATAGLAGLVKKTAEHGDEVAKNAQKVGVGTEAYQEYQYALGQAGLSSQDTDKALGRLNQRMGQAVNGNEKYANALQQLGVDLEEVEKGNITTDEAMMQSIKTLSEMENEQEKAALATEMFGTKLAREMMPAINAGADSLEEGRKKAQELGIVMSEESAQKSEQFNDKLEDLTSRLKGVGMEMGTKLLPIITDSLLPAIEQHIIPALESFGNKLVGLIDWFTNLNPTMQKTILAVTGIVTALGPALAIMGTMVGAISNLVPVVTTMTTVIKSATTAVKLLGIASKIAAIGPIGLIVGAIAGAIAIGVALYKNWDKVSAFLKKIWTATKNIAVSVFGAIGNWISNQFQKVKSIISSVGGWMKSFLSGTFSTIKSVTTSVFGGIKSFFSKTWRGIQSGVQKFKNTFLSIWDSIKSGVSSITSPIAGSVNGVLGGIEGAVNGVAKGINSLPSFDIPDWVPGIGGGSFGLPNVPTLSLPKVPSLDVGTNRVKADGLAMLHKGEAVVPKKYNPAVDNRTRNNDGSNDQPIKVEVPVHLDGREVARVTAPHVDRELGRKRNEKSRARGGR